MSFPEDSCSVTINAHSGNDWTFTVSGALDGYTKTIQVDLTRDAAITINSWQEF